ncbi:hypothetical protein [Endothiovibrio diazotrophicus]
MQSVAENLHDSYQVGEAFGSIENLLEKHSRERLDSLNLIVSENRLSERARGPLGSDIQARYAASFYAGTEPAQEIIFTVGELAKRVFSAEYANIAPISGNVALLAVIFALTRSGEAVGRIPPFFPGGGYPLNYETFERRSLPLPFSEKDWQIDLPRTLALLEEQKPPLVVLGSSIVTYPMPVTEVAEVVHGYGGVVAYDGSHTLGLIAGGQYQDPLREGADILLGSTHKTFPGPQGGIILSNDEELHKRVEQLANLAPLNGPTMICNPHLARIASTGIVLEETRWYEYAEQVVRNARVIARVFLERGVPAHGLNAQNFPELTYCHQVITDYPVKQSIRLRDRLQRHHINVDGFVRVGVSEITRLGFREAECRVLGECMASLMTGEVDYSHAIDTKIRRLVDSHRTVVL